MEVIRTDCLVIGAGLAGSAYALYAALQIPARSSMINCHLREQPL